MTFSNGTDLKKGKNSGDIREYQKDQQLPRPPCKEYWNVTIHWRLKIQIEFL
jgi:hypothetical protein